MALKRVQDGGIIGNQLCIAIVLLSVALMVAATPVQAVPYRQQLLAKEMPAATATGVGVGEDSANYGDQMERQGNSFANKWPSLRDLLLTADYDESNGLESHDQLNSRLLARLRKLSVHPNDIDDDDQSQYLIDGDLLMAMPVKKLNGLRMTTTMREHNTKKNVQYMSPCHFKICNMGRKRNAEQY